MTDTPSIKLFDFNRMAKFQHGGDTIYVVPGEIVCILDFDDSEVWIEYGTGRSTTVKGTLQSVEDEINRALGATYAAHLQATRESGEKLSDILRKVKSNAGNDDEEIFNMNDFVPKTGVN